MRMLATSYTLSATTTFPFADAVERVQAELKTEGFGVLCAIDVQATMREKLGVEGEPYLILGACNPPLAHQALQAEPDLGVLLPCNVVVYQRDGQTHIAAIDPERMLSIVDTTSSPGRRGREGPARHRRRACRRRLTRSCSDGVRRVLGDEEHCDRGHQQREELTINRQPGGRL